MNELSKRASAAGPGPQRRAFFKLGAVPVVLGTMASKPVLANGSGDSPPYHCTISGKLSGNMSAPHDNTSNCRIGKSPGYWKNHATWPGGLVHGDMPANTCSFSGVTKGTVFNGYVNGSNAFIDAYRRASQTVSSTTSCNVIDLRNAGYGSISSASKATMLQILEDGGGTNVGEIAELGRVTVATLLNSLQYPTFPLEPEQVIAMFNAVAPVGGLYQVNVTTTWNATQVIAHFQSLYS